MEIRNKPIQDCSVQEIVEFLRLTKFTHCLIIGTFDQYQRLTSLHDSENLGKVTEEEWKHFLSFVDSMFSYYLVEIMEAGLQDWENIKKDGGLKVV